MGIILSSQADVSITDGTNALLDTFGQAVGIPGLSDGGLPSRQTGITEDLQALQDYGKGILDKLQGGGARESFDPNFVGSGKQVAVGGGIAQGKVSPLEEASERQIYSQTPNMSVVIKKRAFSSLQDLYKPELMDPAELWLLRATKRLIARKCAIMSDYERLSKIAKLSDQGANPAAIIFSLMSSLGAVTDNKTFGSALRLESAARAREPVTTTTYYIDPELPMISKVGPGQGVFEITTVSTLNTNLDLDGNGSCSFTLEDPYHILFVTEADIEAAIKDTALSNFINMINRTASTVLDLAQRTDAQLSVARRNRGKSQITFTIDIRGNGKARATVDSIGLEVTDQNIDDIPENEAFTDEERGLFERVFEGLTSYSAAMRNGFLNGLGSVSSKDLKKDMAYARRRMRAFYLGKSIIQPMDSVHIFIDGGTRRSGEGEDLGQRDTNIFTLSGALNVASGLLQEANVDDSLLKVEWEQDGKHMKFEDFKKLRTMDSSGDGSGTHVFAGLVESVNDKYEAESGKYTLSISCESNMKWLKLSRYNGQPSLNQTQGIIYDPLTPFDIKTDPATGLPTGEVVLSETNQKRINSSTNCARLYFRDGPKPGTQIVDLKSGKQDIQRVGGSLITLFQHAPGLVYKWKEGIMTATYDMQTIDPKDGTIADKRQLRRDVGFFNSNTPFDNMDSANIISVLVTGMPYNHSSFMQSTVHSRAFIPDTSLNSGTDFFHSFFSMQRTVNAVQGNFIPFKRLDTNPEDLAKAVNLQYRLTGKSNEISQLRTQIAEVEDKIKFFGTGEEALVAQLKLKHAEFTEKLNKAENNFNENLKKGESLKNNIISVAGDDITFDLENIDDKAAAKFFGDRLLHRTLRRREDVIYNKDKNYLIISDEYDKDYDIQSLALRLRDSSPDMWKSSWMPVYDLCRRAAETLDFEFYCMARDTLILTKDENGYIRSKPICQFKNGDQVLSVSPEKQIEWKRASLLKRKLGLNEHMVKIRTGGGYSLTLSNKHRLLDNNLKELTVDTLCSGSSIGTVSCLPNHETEIHFNVERLFAEHKWFQEHGDFFRLGGQGSKCKDIPKKIKLTEDISWFLGLYIAEGSLSDPVNRKNKTSRGYHTTLNLHHDEGHIAEHANNIIKTAFNIGGKIYYYPKYTRCSLNFGSQVFNKFMRRIIGQVSSHTKSIPSCIWSATTSNKLSFLAGLFIGDATFNRRITLTSISDHLLHDVYQLLLMLGIQPRIDKYNKIHIYGKENLKLFAPYLENWKHYNSLIQYCQRDNVCKNRKISKIDNVKNVETVEYDDYVYDLTVADNHTFVLYGTLSHNCDSQGHLVFRPPQYNRTPRTVLEAMIMLDQTAKVRVFPDFLTKLFTTREQSLIQDIKAIEWEIRLNGALLGLKSTEDIATKTGISMITMGGDLQEAFGANKPLEPKEKTRLLVFVREANSAAQIRAGASEGLFNTSKKNVFSQVFTVSSVKESYDEAVNELSKITGRQKRGFGEFDDVKVGAKRNGQTTPASDTAKILSKISGLVSKRSKLLLTLERILEQGIQIGSLEGSGVRLTSSLITNSGSNEIFGKLIEDDSKNILGHMSGSRFIIKDEHIKSQTFTERPPEITVANVNGTDPIVGESNGNIAGGMPIYAAYSVDFDLWRQYGFRSEKSYEKPFFWSAELQCAPYAAMLLSRQRKNIVTGNVTVFGNEFYQLGDVVYVANRQLLYYVHKVSHSISYQGDFSTTLDLRYGRAPGEYIPTPLDIIGKNVLNGGAAQNAYRVRRQSSEGETYLASVVFPKNSNELFGGEYGVRNFRELIKAGKIASQNLDQKDVKNSPRIYIMAFVNGKEAKIASVKNWFLAPTNSVGGVTLSTDTSILKNIKIESSLLHEQTLNQCIDVTLDSVERELLKRGVVAHEKSHFLDPTLENIVEIRLRHPPPGGWKKE